MKECASPTHGVHASSPATRTPPPAASTARRSPAAIQPVRLKSLRVRNSGRGGSPCNITCHLSGPERHRAAPCRVRAVPAPMLGRRQEARGGGEVRCSQ
eukprot:scaffold97174_cov66-Phaeocystis_antarctica.AAC.1